MIHESWITWKSQKCKKRARRVKMEENSSNKRPERIHGRWEWYLKNLCPLLSHTTCVSLLSFLTCTLILVLILFANLLVYTIIVPSMTSYLQYFVSSWNTCYFLVTVGYIGRLFHRWRKKEEEFLLVVPWKLCWFLSFPGEVVRQEKTGKIEGEN